MPHLLRLHIRQQQLTNLASKLDKLTLFSGSAGTSVTSCCIELPCTPQGRLCLSSKLLGMCLGDKRHLAESSFMS